ncbi:MAG: DUF5717 family protein [Lachnospiraceae bacterium]
MNIKVEELLKKKMETKKRTLHISCKEIYLNIEKDQIANGFFLVGADSKEEYDIEVISSDMRFQCDCEGFNNETGELYYQFNSFGMQVGDTLSGHISILSSYGEISIPFYINIIPKVEQTSLGEIKNLFHFTNLAKTNWEEAVTLFYHHSFYDLLKETGKEYCLIYRGLTSKDICKNQRVEEFLQRIQKKYPIMYEIKKELFIPILQEEIPTEYLTIQKKGWGYDEILIELDGKFIELEQKRIKVTDFTEEVYTIPIKINGTAIHAGKNYGKIIIKTNRETFEVSVLAHQKKYKSAKGKTKNYIQKSKVDMMMSYIAFRSKKISSKIWLKKMYGILDHFETMEDKFKEYAFFYAHVLITEGKTNEGRWQLEKCEVYVKESQDTSLYAYYLYLTTLLSQEKEYIKQVEKEILELYYEHSTNWNISWLLLFLSEELNKNASKKYEFIKELLCNGCKSPLLYLEAVLLLNEFPTLLSTLSDWELRILKFGVKYDCISKELYSVITYNALHKKEYDQHSMEFLIDSYKIYENQELLQAITCLLMKGDRKDAIAFSFYKLAIENQLRITKLYEFYMQSIDLIYEEEIPQIVLMYFTYKNYLDYKQCAYLYRFLHKNREKYEEIYISYQLQIERFIIKQLYAERIDECLAYLYCEIFCKEMITYDNSKEFVKILFTHVIKNLPSNIKKVIVVHERLKKETTYQVEDGQVFPKIYGKRNTIFLEDINGNRVVKDKSIECRALLPIQEIAVKIKEYMEEEIGFNLYLYDQDIEFMHINEENKNRLYHLANCEEIQEKYKEGLRIKLVRFYYEQDYILLLDEYLNRIEICEISVKDYKAFIHLLLLRGFFEKVYQYIITYGPEYGELKSMLYLIELRIEELDFTEDQHLLWLCKYCFIHKIYNETILKYLVLYAKGTTKDLRKIAKIADSFLIDTYHICERILQQMIKTQEFLPDEIDVFSTYIKGSAKLEIEQMYLAHAAFEYFIKEDKINGIVINEIIKIYRRKESLHSICKLAVLYFYCNKLSTLEENLIQLLKEMAEDVIIKERLIFRFLKKYSHLSIKLEWLNDISIVEYKTQHNQEIMLHYLLRKNGSNQNFNNEKLKYSYYGIYTKKIIVFSQEELQYYISEEQKNSEQLTKSASLHYIDNSDIRKIGKFQKINELAVSQEEQISDKTLTLLEEYWKLDFITEQVFKPL